jgi:hypothetical protein
VPRLRRKTEQIGYHGKLSKFVKLSKISLDVVWKIESNLEN